MRLAILSALALCAVLSAAEADPLAAALKGQDGDVFAADRIQEVLMLSSRAQRAAAVRRIADSGRDDVYPILHRLIQDEDQASAEIAIDALAKRWPTSMDDVELVRTMLGRDGRVGAAACRYAAAVGDDEALPALADRITRSPSDADAEAALRRLTVLPGGCGPEGWTTLVETRFARQEAALSGAENLLLGTPAEAMGAVTLIAGMRPAGSRAARVLLAAAEHPDRTVRRMAISILSTCESPAAMAWRNRGTANGTDGAMAAAASEAQPMAAPAPVTAFVLKPGAAQSVAASLPQATATSWVIWLVALGVATTLACAGWLFVRRRQGTRSGSQANQPRQARFTWVG